MTPNRLLSSALALLLVVVQAAHGQSEPLRLNWEELGGAVANHKATLILTGNVRVEGKVESVQDQALVMNVFKSSDSKRLAPGQASIPRGDIAEIRVKRVKGMGRLAGAAGLGALGSLVSLRWALSEERVNVSDASRLASWIAISGASVAGGYLLGRAFDTHEITILVVSSATEGSNR